MATFKKTGALAISPELDGNIYNLFLDRNTTVQPGEKGILSTSVAVDREQCHISIYSKICANIFEEVSYQNKEEITLEYQNNTPEIISLKRGLNIAYFTVYKQIEPIIELVESFTKGLNVEIKLNECAVLPRKVDTHYVFYSGEEYQILPNEEIRLKTQIQLSLPDNFAISIESKFGKACFLDEEELAISYRNDTENIKFMKRKFPILKARFYELQKDPYIPLVDRFRGERKRRLDESLPCCTNSLF